MLNLLIYIALQSAGMGEVPAVRATTEPSVASISWQLHFRYQDPQRVSVMLPGVRQPAVYWYMLYTIDNPGEQEVEFYPRIELVTDTLQVVPSEIRVSPEAFRAIQRRSQNPLLVPPEQAVGQLLRGEDRARYSVAIWRNVDPKARAFRVYVGGLSGEMARVKNPSFDAEQPENAKNQRYYTLRKTLVIPYKLPGGSSTRELAIPERVLGDEMWTMR